MDRLVGVPMVLLGLVYFQTGDLTTSEGSQLSSL